MKKLLTLLILTTGLTYSQTPYWLSGDGYNIYNGNRGNVLLGVRSPFASKLAIDPGNEAYGIALTSDQGQYGNYVQIGVLGRNMDILQGRLLFNLHTSNTDIKFAGYDFRLADKSLFYISGEGNVGIGTITKNPPTARLQIEGGPIWSTDGYKRSLLLGNQDAIGFSTSGYKFGLGANGSSLNFFSTLQESNAQTQRILTLQPNSVTVEGDLIVKGNVISNGQMGQNHQRGGYGPLLGAVGDPVTNPWLEGTGGPTVAIYYNGNVGIGTASPSAKLDINGTLALSGQQIAGYGSSSISLGDIVSGDGLTPILRFCTNDAERMRIDGNGNVGIGTTNPTYKLHVEGDYTGRQMYVTSAIQVGAYTTLQTHPELDNNYRRLLLASGAYYDWANNRYQLTNATYDRAALEILNNGHISFKTEKLNRSAVGYMTLAEWDGIERMKILNNGNVGIGVASPGGKLDVKLATDTDFLRICRSSGSGRAQMILANESYAEQWRFGMTGGGSTDFNFFDGTQNVLVLKRNGNVYLTLNGSVGIGTSNPDAAYKLNVNGKIKAHELYLITTGWSDFVFSKDYKLRPLHEVEQHIKEKGHLPDIPSQKEVVANGVAVVDMQAKLLQKIEELTLYVIEQNKMIEALKKENQEIKEKLK